jgi:hypothetical protein
MTWCLLVLDCLSPVAQVSSKRVVDGVPMHLNYYLLQQYCKQLNDLPAKLAAGMTGSESAAEVGRSTAGQAGVEDSSDEEGQVGSKQEGRAAKKPRKGYAVVVDAARLMAEDASTADAGRSCTGN